MNVLQSPPPPDASVRVLLLQEEEKVMMLYINTFPSFLKEGCHARGVTGWFIHFSDTTYPHTKIVTVIQFFRL